MQLENVDSLNLVAALALHQHKRDVAIGLNHITSRVRGLLWFYNLRQRELLGKVAKASFRLGAIRQIDKRMAQIMTEAQNAPLERKRELLKEAVELQKQAKKLRKLG
jgi:hypothetical protein